MSALFKIAFLSAVLFLFSATTRATSVGTRPEHCPLCDHDYMVTVLLSYNNFSGNGGPPKMPPSSCPFCLAVWTGDPPESLTDPQRRALGAALKNRPADLSVSEKQNLLRELEERYSDVPERIGAALQTRCAAALKGEAPPKFEVKPSRIRKESDDPDHRTFLKELPRLIRAQKEGKEAVIKPDFEMSSPDIVTLQQAQREIVNGNALAFEYFVRWTVAVDDSVLLAEDRTTDDVFGDILFDVARCQKLPWPKDVDIGKARSAFAAACLRYAYEPARPLDTSLKKVIADFKPYARAQIALMAAAGKKDRTVAPLLASLEPSRVDLYGDAFVLYYQRVGNAGDLRFLETCATDAMKRFESAATRGEDEGWRYRAPLRAYEIVRLKCRLMGDAGPVDRTK